MGYQITYGFAGDAKRVDLWKIRLKRLGMVATGVLFLLCVLWISGADWSVTVSAMDDMVETLSQGADFVDAFSEFCIDILQGAELG